MPVEELDYEGWSTYATCLLNLAIDNNVRTSEKVRAMTRHCIDNRHKYEEVIDGNWTPNEAAGSHLADDLRDWVETEIGDTFRIIEQQPKADFIGAFCAASFCEVNWKELAESLIDEMLSEDEVRQLRTDKEHPQTKPEKE